MPLSCGEDPSDAMSITPFPVVAVAAAAADDNKEEDDDEEDADEAGQRALLPVESMMNSRAQSRVNVGGCFRS